MTIPAEAEPEAEHRNKLPNHQIEDLGKIARTAEAILGLSPIAELAQADFQDKRIIAVEQLLNSRRRTQELYGLEEITWQPPSPKKYPDWFKWDQAFADEMFFETADYCWERAAYYESRLDET